MTKVILITIQIPGRLCLYELLNCEVPQGGGQQLAVDWGPLFLDMELMVELSGFCFNFRINYQGDSALNAGLGQTRLFHSSSMCSNWRAVGN